MNWLWFILIFPGLVCAYFFFVRPILKAIPQFQKFYVEADGFWAKVSALGGHSASIAWGYFMMLVGIVAQWLEPTATAVGDPDFKSQLTDALGAHPKVLGYFLMGISAVTIVARLRSLTKG